jgi:hypothetical protein
MENTDALWEKIKNLSDEEWRGLRSRRDLIKQRNQRKADWRSFVGVFPSEDLEQMKDVIEAECERIDPNDWD